MTSRVHFGWKPTTTAIFVGIRHVGVNAPTTSLRNHLLIMIGHKFHHFHKGSHEAFKHFKPVSTSFSLTVLRKGGTAKKGCTRQRVGWVEKHPPWKRSSTADETPPLSSRGYSTSGVEGEDEAVFPFLSPSRTSRHFLLLSLNLALCNNLEYSEPSVYFRKR